MMLCISERSQSRKVNFILKSEQMFHPMKETFTETLGKIWGNPWLLQGVGSAHDIFRGSCFILQMDRDII